jgi:hypothetical protein
MKVVFDGADDLSRKLLSMADVLTTPDAAAVIRAAARKIRDGARRRAPKGRDIAYTRFWGAKDKRQKTASERKSGALRKGIIGGAWVGKSRRQIVSYVKVNYKPRHGAIAPHGHLVEFGTKARVPAKRKYMSFVASSSRGVIFAKRAAAIPARPYFKPAVDSEGQAALAAATLQFDRIVKRLGLSK